MTGCSAEVPAGSQQTASLVECLAWQNVTQREVWFYGSHEGAFQNCAESCVTRLLDFVLVLLETLVEMPKWEALVKVPVCGNPHWPLRILSTLPLQSRSVGTSTAK